MCALRNHEDWDEVVADAKADFAALTKGSGGLVKAPSLMMEEPGKAKTEAGTAGKEEVAVKAPKSKKAKRIFRTVSEAAAACGPMTPIDASERWRAAVEEKRWEEMRVRFGKDVFPLKEDQQRELEKWASGGAYDDEWLEIHRAYAAPRSFVSMNGTKGKLMMLEGE